MTRPYAFELVGVKPADGKDDALAKLDEAIAALRDRGFQMDEAVASPVGGGGVEVERRFDEDGADRG